ncbi:hypothetical protein GCM10023317_96770 [Actinopolymorpha pittospori]
MEQCSRKKPAGTTPHQLSILLATTEGTVLQQASTARQRECSPNGRYQITESASG